VFLNNNPDLQAKRDVLWDHTRAPATVRAYRRELIKFRNWAVGHGVYFFPVPFDVVTLYLTHVAHLTESVPMTNRAAAALRSAHRRRNMASPTDLAGVKDLLKGVANRYGRPPHSVLPLTASLLSNLLRALMSRKPSAVQMRTAWVALFTYQATARCGDVKHLQVKHLTFAPTGELIVKFPKLKNVPVSRGFRVTIYPQSGRWCPVRCTKKYIKSLRLKPVDFLVPVIYKRMRHGKAHYSVSPRRVASNAALRLHFRDALRAAKVEDATAFGLHSPRRGATLALREAGVSAEDISYRVGWKSRGMVSHYTRDAASVQSRQSQILAVPM